MGIKAEIKPGFPTVLIIEDDALIQHCAQRFCEQLNCNVAVASHAIEALGLYLYLKPHLILLDVGLPGISGLEVCKIIRVQEKTFHSLTPIIAVTGFSHETEEECRMAGVNDFFIKPLLRDQLKELLHKWLPEYRSAIYEIKRDN